MPNGDSRRFSLASTTTGTEELVPAAWLDAAGDATAAAKIAVSGGG